MVDQLQQRHAIEEPTYVARTLSHRHRAPQNVWHRCCHQRSEERQVCGTQGSRGEDASEDQLRVV